VETKKRVIKLIKILFIIAYTIIFAGLLTLKFWRGTIGLELPLISLIYWLILFGWIFLIWQFKWPSRFSFILGFILFIIAALFTTFLERNLGETIMRTSFIFWLVGTGQALQEFKRQNVFTRN
jgi:hypothetical protein